MGTKKIPASMVEMIEHIKKEASNDEKLQTMFEHAFSNTYETTLRKKEDGTTFVITGDIPAMWLRDSAAQVRPYLILAETDSDMADMIQGVIQKQMEYIAHDPYANAFNDSPSGDRYHDDETEMTPWLWERKYEIDSLCYPIQLAYLFWKSTGRTDHFNESFRIAVKKALKVWKVEQNHATLSTYSFKRDNCPAQDTLSHNGKGAPVTYTGMSWSGFRPSDDACKYGYLVPANMFIVVVLKQLTMIAEEVFQDAELATHASVLGMEIDRGIQQYAKVEHPRFGTIYAYETDGYGNYNLMDDANVPSLLSIPYLGYCDFTDEVYQNTRNFIMSTENPYYYEGEIAKGVGSPHTPAQYIWHIALAIQGMTATTEKEKKDVLHLFKQTDAGTNLMHEGFHVDDPNQYTRAWFSWANSMFSEFVLYLHGKAVKGSPLEIK